MIDPGNNYELASEEGVHEPAKLFASSLFAHVNKNPQILKGVNGPQTHKSHHVKYSKYLNGALESTGTLSSEI